VTITNGYSTLSEIKSTDVLNFSNTDHDTILEAVIEGISRSIDNWTGQHFYSASETRYYTASDAYCLRVDGISTSSGLVIYTDVDGDGTYENTWAATDYQLAPYNASLEGLPYTKIETTILGSYWFPSTRKGVKITAAFGWAAVPKPINRACVLQATRLFKRYVTPLGQAGASSVGVITLSVPALDPDVTMLLAPYRWRT
jgi:hypothetical protein